MEAWVFALLVRGQPIQYTRPIDIQSEDACVLFAKEMTLHTGLVGFCLNTFDGKVLWFKNGKQVERP